MSSQTVYAVSCGEYSDYGIVAVFSTRELAEAFCLQKNGPERDKDGNPVVTYGDEHRIEEWELDVEPVPQTGAYRVTIYESGAVERKYWDANSLPTAPVEQYEYPFGLTPGKRFVGYGETIEHARRSAEEYRRAVLTGNIV